MARPGQCRERPELELAHIGRLETPGTSPGQHQQAPGTGPSHTKKILIKAPRSRGSLAIAGPRPAATRTSVNISLWLCVRHGSGDCPVQCAAQDVDDIEDEEGEEGEEDDDDYEDDGSTPLLIQDRRSAQPSPVCQASKVKRWNLEF